MYAVVKGKNVWIYKDSGVSVRMIPVAGKILQATMSGETVVVVTDDGFTSVYNLSGQRIRHTQ